MQIHGFCIYIVDSVHSHTLMCALYQLSLRFCHIIKINVDIVKQTLVYRLFLRQRECEKPQKLAIKLKTSF